MSPLSINFIWRSILRVVAISSVVSGSLPAAIVHVVAEPPVQTSPFIPITELDLNGDGQPELTIRNGSANLMLLPTASNRITQQVNTFRVASVSDATFIGAQLDDPLLEWAGLFSPTLGSTFQFCASNGAGRFCSGNFREEPGYYGIEFDIGGALHYGWIRAVADTGFVISTTFEWAYEDVPGRPIRAGAIPEPSTVALLAPALALIALRRRRTR